MNPLKRKNLLYRFVHWGRPLVFAATTFLTQSLYANDSDIYGFTTVQFGDLRSIVTEKLVEQFKLVRKKFGNGYEDKSVDPHDASRMTLSDWPFAYSLSNLSLAPNFPTVNVNFFFDQDDRLFAWEFSGVSRPVDVFSATINTADSYTKLFTEKFGEPSTKLFPDPLEIAFQDADGLFSKWDVMGYRISVSIREYRSEFYPVARVEDTARATRYYRALKVQDENAVKDAASSF